MRTLLVDGFNMVRRIYAAVPEDARAQNVSREQNVSKVAATGAADEHLDEVIASGVASLRRALQQHHPSHCLAVFDGFGKNWRHELYPDYKKNRAPMPPPLRAGLENFKRAFAGIHVMSFSHDNFEADDVIATLAAKIAARGGNALILSTDRNYCQLLGAHIKVFDHFAQRYLDDDLMLKKFNAQPHELPELFALAGDSGASIPGVKSVGMRTAAKLLRAHGGMEKIFLAVKAGNIRGKLAANLSADRAHAQLAKKLFTLRTDLNLGINLNNFRYSPATAETAAETAATH